MRHRISSLCQCEDDVHGDEECLHAAIGFQFTGAEPVAMCLCCLQHKHMTPERTPVPEAE